jgi:16S rRNA (adenine1518-N6/adenine1519-N6)-dimethyltransferase
MSRTSSLKERMQELGIEPKKAFGQNFLISDHVIEKIIDAVAAEKIASLVEIGPGLGALTEGMKERGMTPLLIELDRTLVEYWRKHDYTVVDQDALQLDWDALKLPTPTLLVSNLPYQISTSLLIDRCFGPASITTMVLMFQKEVAERFVAKPKTKEYGLLSVMAQLFWDIEKVANAAPGDFFPPPKIASRVLRWRRKPALGLDQKFLKFLKAAFLYRRKFLLKNLKGSVTKGGEARLREVFAELKLNDKSRAEELTPQQFVELFRKLFET